jgi:hypothetical protein
MTAGVIDEYPRLLRSKKVMITAVPCSSSHFDLLCFCVCTAVFALR